MSPPLRAVVLGGGGFIGGHLVTRLKKEGYWVRAVDLKSHDYGTDADEFLVRDLREASVVDQMIEETMDEVYQLAADMGGAGYIFSGVHDADIMHNSALINLHVVKACVKKKIKKVFYSSSACIYPEYNQLDPENPKCSEESAYPAMPDSEYGWEKLFSERLFLAHHRNHGLDVKIARFHNIFGPLGTWCGGKEKAPAALCRKVAEAPDGGSVEIWGDGTQTRSFLYVDECVEAVRPRKPVPLISVRKKKVSMNELAQRIITISGKSLSLRHIDGPLGVRGRNSDNRRIRKALGYEPITPLNDGLASTYAWIQKQLI